MPAPRDHHDLATRFAPRLHLHPKEEFLPMDPEAFIEKSRLVLLQDRPGGFEPVAVFDLEQRQWDTDPPDWKHFGLSTGLVGGWEQLQVVPEDAGWSRRPHDSSLAPDGHLFALEHQTKEPSDAFDPADPPPCFYFVEERQNATWISYWFFYGFSRFLGKFAHQGDWEHLRIRIQDDTMDEALFAVHEDVYRVRRHLLSFNGDALNAYSARSRHATWWKTGSFVPLPLFKDTTPAEEVLSREERALLSDETSEEGAVWQTRLNLQPLEEQPWRLFAGAWGKAGGAAHGTGPLGPWQKRFLAPDRKIIEED